MKNFVYYVCWLFAFVFSPLILAQTPEDPRKLYCPEKLTCQQDKSKTYSECRLEGRTVEYWGRHNESKKDDEIWIYNQTNYDGDFYLNKVRSVYQPKKGEGTEYRGPECQYNNSNKTELKITLAMPYYYAHFKAFLDSSTQWDIADEIKECFPNGNAEACPMIQKNEIVVGNSGTDSLEYQFNMFKGPNYLEHDYLNTVCRFSELNCKLGILGGRFWPDRRLALLDIFVDITKENEISVVGIFPCGQNGSYCNNSLHVKATKDPRFNIILIHTTTS
jgi:hypothetical protein